jgi:DNA modification methylase
MTAFNEDVMSDALFQVDAPTCPISLSDRFGVPPFSVLDRRSETWMNRKRRWLSMGFDSGIGRDSNLAFNHEYTDYFPKMDTTSVFDPVLCELVYRWFTRPGARVLDPFCGGSVRGVVASSLARWYTGVDIRQEQVDANVGQLNLCSDISPNWICGDATKLRETFTSGEEFDLVFTCPPYADLEVYSDDIRDISTWSYDDFLVGHASAIRESCDMLRNDRYAAWVIGDIRDKRGKLRGLHHETVKAFIGAGLNVVNEFVMVDPVGTAAIRAGKPFSLNRKSTMTHQHLLVFVKGDVRKAADWANGLNQG